MELRDIERMDLPNGDRLVSIFRRQRELMQRYESIEDANGLLQTPDIPVDLHSRMGQARLKDFAWRITEELGEAAESYESEPETFHFKEEIADALHFLVEFTILAGVKPHELKSIETEGASDLMSSMFDPHTPCSHVDYDHFIFLVGRFIQKLAVACNLLKNRPWKQTLRKTDIPAFKEALNQTWIQFSYVVYAAGISAQEMFELYFGKSVVNKQRQKDGY